MNLLREFADLQALYGDKVSGLRWPYVFCLPGWLDAWWRSFGAGYELSIIPLRQEGQLLGVAPFKRRGGTVSFIGDEAVCDYLDFVVAPGHEAAFAEALFAGLAARGVSAMELATLRPDSVAVRHILPLAESRGFKIDCRQSDVSYETALPHSLEAYLEGLDGKQRHELMRKRRRFEDEGGLNFAMLKDAEVTQADMELFFTMMSESRRDKAGFLTDDMKVFFRDMVRAVASYGALRLGFLRLGRTPVAAVLCFDYNNGIYLYNSGYMPDYARLSAGILSKLEAIGWAIGQGKQLFDFLKGAEIYKERLGGHQVKLSACRVTFS